MWPWFEPIKWVLILKLSKTFYDESGLLFHVHKSYLLTSIWRTCERVWQKKIPCRITELFSSHTKSRNKNSVKLFSEWCGRIKLHLTLPTAESWCPWLHLQIWALCSGACSLQVVKSTMSYVWWYSYINKTLHNC